MMWRADRRQAADAPRELGMVGDDHPRIEPSHAVPDDVKRRAAGLENSVEAILEVGRARAERSGEVHVRLVDDEAVRPKMIGDAVEIPHADVDPHADAEQLTQPVETENAVGENDRLRAHALNER